MKTTGMTRWSLQPLAQQDWAHTNEINLAGESTTLGRSQELEIPARETSVSRKHCEVKLLARGEVELYAHKTVWRKSMNGSFEPCTSGSKMLVRSDRTAVRFAARTSYAAHRTCLPVQLLPGEALYLAKSRTGFRYGFRVAATDEPTKSPSTATKRLRTAEEEKPLSAKRQRASQQQQQSSRPQFLNGVHFVVWNRQHTKHAIERAKAVGAVVEGEIDSKTTHVIAAKGMTKTEVAEKLGQKAENLQWPMNVDFVSPDFLTGCLAQGRLLSPERYRISAHRSELGEADRKTEATPDSEKPENKPQGSSSEQEAVGESGQGNVQSHATSAKTSQKEEPRDLPFSGSIVDPEKATGGNSGRPWGAGAVWIEPWEDAAVKETLHRLDQHWHRQDLGGAASPSKSTDMLELGAGSDSDQDAEDAFGRAGAGDCPHASCSESQGCIIKELKLLISQYDRGGTDQFRRRAAERAVRKVAEHAKPLKSRKDVEALQLGKESTAKVAEIVENGTLSRNNAFLADPKAQTIAKFASVWGAAKRTAEKWYSDGCRSLDDARKRTDLTEQQKGGLKHFEDLKVRIPHDEGIRIAKTVQQAALELFGWDMEGPDIPHIRPMGSFLRGKPATTDVDILILPPTTEEKGPAEMMNILLGYLREQGFVTDDMNPHKTRSLTEHSCTFLGFCKLPGQQHVRRLDIKIYPRWSLPFAVNYFTGSGSFNRALRYWAMTAPDAVEVAKKWALPSTGLKLSDMALAPIRRVGIGADRREEAVGPPVPGIGCESDIFKTLNLSYVPPHKRFFHDYQ